MSFSLRFLIPLFVIVSLGACSHGASPAPDYPRLQSAEISNPIPEISGPPQRVGTAYGASTSAPEPKEDDLFAEIDAARARGPIASAKLSVPSKTAPKAAMTLEQRRPQNPPPNISQQSPPEQIVPTWPSAQRLVCAAKCRN